MPLRVVGAPTPVESGICRTRRQAVLTRSALCCFLLTFLLAVVEGRGFPMVPVPRKGSSLVVVTTRLWRELLACGSPTSPLLLVPDAWPSAGSCWRRFAARCRTTWAADVRDRSTYPTSTMDGGGWRRVACRAAASLRRIVSPRWRPPGG